MDAVKLLGSLLSSNATGGSMLGSLLKKATGGGADPQQQSSGGLGGLGGLLSGALGGGSGGGSGGGLMGMLMKGAAGAGGAGLLGSLMGGGETATQAPPEPPAQEAQDQATILIRAMCNAAKSDGEVDQAEQQAILKRLGDLDQAEADFLRQEFAAPLDVQGFAKTVPQELATQVYALSCATVKVDTREEVAYLQQLGQALQLDGGTLKGIHEQLGLA